MDEERHGKAGALHLLNDYGLTADYEITAEPTSWTEGHRPDLSGCPPHKLARSKKQNAEIGSEGAMGRLLTRGSKSHDFVDELQPILGEIVLDKPGKGAFVATDLDLILRQRGIQKLLLTGVTTECCKG